MADTYIKPAAVLKQERTKLPVADQLLNYRLYIPIVLCFKLASDADFKRIFSNLIAGLSYTLVDIPFLAGHVVQDKGDAGRIELDVNTSPGVEFKFRDLSAGCTYDELEQTHFAPSKLASLLPKPAFKVGAGLDEPVLHLEANFIGGGLLLMVYVHHSASDASAWSRILRTWSNYTNAAASGWKQSPARLSPDALDRSPLFDDTEPFALENCPEIRPVEIAASGPTPQKAAQAENPLEENHYEQKLALEPSAERAKPSIAYWYFSSEKLQKLKESAKATHPTDPWVSTSDVLFALIWRRSMAARSLLERGVESSTFWMPIDVRSRLQLHPDYMGNAVYMAHVRSPMSAIYSTEPDALFRTASEIRRVTDSVDELKVRRTWGLMESMGPTSFTHNFDFLSGADLIVTSMAKYDWYHHNWGCDLGSITCVRWKLDFMLDGVCMVKPKFQDGSLELVMFYDPQVLERLKADEDFTAFAEFRCS